MDGPDLRIFAAIAALCLAAAQAAAQQAPLPLPAEIDASGPGKPKGEGNARNAAQQARKESDYRAALKKCDDLQRSYSTPTHTRPRRVYPGNRARHR